MANSHYTYSGAFSRLYLFDTDDTCADAVGYSTFELYEGAEDNLQAIYSQIALGNGYRFDLRESYSVAASTDTTESKFGVCLKHYVNSANRCKKGKIYICGSELNRCRFFST